MCACLWAGGDKIPSLTEISLSDSRSGIVVGSSLKKSHVGFKKKQRNKQQNKKHAYCTVLGIQFFFSCDFLGKFNANFPLIHVLYPFSTVFFYQSLKIFYCIMILWGHKFNQFGQTLTLHFGFACCRIKTDNKVMLKLSKRNKKVNPFHNSTMKNQKQQKQPFFATCERKNMFRHKSIKQSWYF